jgi:extracellular factor (EF) 3-hydroxypalmitic acid methyl ester biosynthesis protein
MGCQANKPTPVVTHFLTQNRIKRMETLARVQPNLKEEISNIVRRGGPDVKEYQYLDNLMYQLSTELKTGKLSPDELTGIRSAFGPALSNTTMQGFMWNKPRGYAGDFEIIERMYDWYVSPNSTCAKWDLFLQNHAASRAVRNRKTYFKQVIKAYMERHNRTEIRLLDLASGPCTELAEFIRENPQYRIIADCVDIDSDAIRYAQGKLAHKADDVRFIKKNVFRFVPDCQYDIIWSAGLFDYFNDKQFVQLISRFSQYIAPKGELIIGNFADNHPSQHYMDLVDWHLNYRNEDHLLALGREATGASTDLSIRVGREPENVNLFLHLSR